MHSRNKQTKADKGTTPRIAQTARGPIEYVDSGSGPVVIAIHGAMGGYDQSDLLARTVGGPGFRFLSVSRPGYLGTPLRGGCAPEDQADLLAALLDTLDITSAAVMAVSGGGPSALFFALRHPARCRGLVLISTCGGVVGTKIPLSFKVMKQFMRWQSFVCWMRKKAESNIEQNLRRSISDPATLTRVMQDPEVFPLLCELTMSSFHRMPERLAGTDNDIRVTRTTAYPLEQIRVPTLVVHGLIDPLLPFEQHGKQLAERIPGAELLAVEGGEHVTIFTHRELVRARVMRFLSELPVNAAS